MVHLVMHRQSYSRRLALNIISLFLLTACSAGRLIVRSDPPDADAFVRAQGAEEKKPLGKTPVDLSLSDFSKTLGGSPSSGEYFEVVVEKKGFLSQRLMVPPYKFGTSTVTVLVKLVPGDETIKDPAIVLETLHNAQKFANAGQFERALIDVDKVLDKYPEFVRALSLKGSILYMQDKLTESQALFEKALKIDPGFDDAVKMIEQIKKKQGAK